MYNTYKYLLRNYVWLLQIIIDTICFIFLIFFNSATTAAAHLSFIKSECLYTFLFLYEFVLYCM